MSATDRYRITFYAKVDSEKEYEKLKDALFSWVRSFHNPDWPVCGFGRSEPKSANFLIESTAPLDLCVHDAVKKIFLECGCPVTATLVVPPYPAS